MPSIDEAPGSLVSKFISSRRSIAAYAGEGRKDVSESWSGLVNVSEEAVKAELKRAEEMAVLNKLCSAEIDELHELLFALKLQQKQLQASVSALIGPAAHIASGPVVEAKQTLSDMRLYTPHLTDSSLLQDCLCRTLSEMKSLQTEFKEKWGQ